MTDPSPDIGAIDPRLHPYCATGDGTTDDTAAVQAALSTGRPIRFTGGVYVVSQLAPAAGQTIDGTATFLLKDGTNDSLFLIHDRDDVRIGPMVVLIGNSINNPSGGIGVRVQGTSSGCVIECTAADFRIAGVSFTGTGTRNVFTGTARSNVFDGFVSNAARTHVIGGHAYGNGRFGYLFGTGSDKSKIVGASASDNDDSGFVGVGDGGDLFDVSFVGCQAFGNGGHGFQFNNATRGVYSGCISHTNGISGFDFTLGSPYGVCSGCVSYLNAVRGIEVDSQSYYASVTGNQVYQNGASGISVFRSSATTIIGNTVNGNGADPGAADRHGVYLWDSPEPSNNCRVIGNNLSDDAGSPTQQYGLYIDANTSGTIVHGNKFSGNVTAATNATSAHVASASGNQGWITRNSGATSVSDGGTILHGLAGTPVRVNVTPTVSGTFASVTAVTASRFTVAIKTHSNGSGATQTVYWEAEYIK